MGADIRVSTPAPTATLAAPDLAIGRGEITAALKLAGIVSHAETIELHALPKNPQRRDAVDTDTYRVVRAGRTWCHLTVGPRAVELGRRIHEFADCCPGIACPPLFSLPVGSRGVTGVAWFEGRSLEDRVREGALDVGRARRVVEGLLQALAATRAPSSPEAAAAEFDGFCERVLSVQVFADIDRELLGQIIFPWLRSQALHGPAETRLTNGDFIARNVLVADEGDARLIDCEFSQRTHFFGVDVWRWRAFSALPPELLNVAAPGEPADTQPWVEVYSILQHLVLVEASQGAAVAVAEARVRIPRLFAVISAAHPGLRASLLWPLLAAAAPAQPAGPENGWINAQLFWSPTGAFIEAQSRRLAYPGGRQARLVFLIPRVEGPLQLRLDPAEAPGLLRIAALRVDRLVDGRRQPLLRCDLDWRTVRVLRGLLELRSTRELALLSLDLDPSLLLPPLPPQPSPADVVVELDLRHDADLGELPGLLPR